MARILQLFSFLIIPALIGRLYTRDPLRILLIGWLAGFAASVIGIGISYKLDLPTAPMTVASLSLVFLVLLVVKAIVRSPEKTEITVAHKKETATKGDIL